MSAIWCNYCHHEWGNYSSCKLIYGLKSVSETGSQGKVEEKVSDLTCCVKAICLGLYWRCEFK